MPSHMYGIFNIYTHMFIIMTTIVNCFLVVFSVLFWRLTAEARHVESTAVTASKPQVPLTSCAIPYSCDKHQTRAKSHRYRKAIAHFLSTNALVPGGTCLSLH